MNETYLPSSKVKVTPYGISPRSSSEVPAPFHGSLSAMPLRLIPGTTCSQSSRTGDKRKHESHGRPRLKSDGIRRYVEQHLRRGWSPELIAGRLGFAYPGQSISHEAIYQWCTRKPPTLLCSWSGPIVSANTEDTPGNTNNPYPGEGVYPERPQAVLARRHPGHWETDTISCRKSYRRCR